MADSVDDGHSCQTTRFNFAMEISLSGSNEIDLAIDG